jgi:hypothetical protein
MTTIIQELSRVTNRMLIISDYFNRFDITNAARENFKQMIKQGKVLVRDLKLNLEKSTQFIDRIENFLIGCEETLYAVGLEITAEYCEIEEDLESFRRMRLLIMLYLSH